MKCWEPFSLAVISKLIIIFFFPCFSSVDSVSPCSHTQTLRLPLPLLCLCSTLLPPALVSARTHLLCIPCNQPPNFSLLITFILGQLVNWTLLSNSPQCFHARFLIAILPWLLSCLLLCHCLLFGLFSVNLVAVLAPCSPWTLVKQLL